MTKKVLMHVDADGVAKIEAEGYAGGACLDATKAFEDIFATTVKEREMAGECAPQPFMGERVTR